MPAASSGTFSGTKPLCSSTYTTVPDSAPSSGRSAPAATSGPRPDSAFANSVCRPQVAQHHSEQDAHHGAGAARDQRGHEQRCLVGDVGVRGEAQRQQDADRGHHRQPAAHPGQVAQLRAPLGRALEVGLGAVGADLEIADARALDGRVALARGGAIESMNKPAMTP